MITFKETKPLKEYDAVSLAEMLRADFVRQYPSGTVERLQDAIQVASYLHRNDVRRGARKTSVNPPYIEHPLRVAIRAHRTFSVINPDAIIAFVLHDTVEDHPFDFSAFERVLNAGNDVEYARAVALGFIGQHFGYAVAKIVDGMSNSILEPGISKTEKIERYHKKVRVEVMKSSEVLAGKVSDFKDNAGSLHHHYAYGDPKVLYFLDRYEPLIEVYRNGLNTGTHDYNVPAMLRALDEVEAQFDQFRAAA